MPHTQPQLVKQSNLQKDLNLEQQSKQSPPIQFREQKLYGWGSNKTHSLLLVQDDTNFMNCYDSINQSVLQPYHSVSFHQVDIIDVSSHFTTSTVLDAQNQIIQFGSILPEISQFINKQSIQQPLFRLIKIPQNINYRHIVTKVASGDQFSVALTVLGQLFTWGSNGHGQLGIDQPSNLISHSPIKISGKGDLKNQFVKNVSCSFNSVLALTRKGEIIGWGYQALLVQPGYSIENQQFQVNKPTKLRFIDDQVVQISSGRLHHCFVTAKGNCHTFGKNRFWQLGYEQQVDSNQTGDESNFYGRKVEFDFEGVKWICKRCIAGLDYCIAQIVNESDGQERLVAWGRNKRGQCGVGNNLQQRIKPQLCQFKGNRNIAAKLLHQIKINKTQKQYKQPREKSIRFYSMKKIKFGHPVLQEMEELSLSHNPMQLVNFKKYQTFHQLMKRLNRQSLVKLIPLLFVRSDQIFDLISFSQQIRADYCSD